MKAAQEHARRAAGLANLALGKSRSSVPKSDAEMIDAEEQAEASLAEARLLASDEGIPIQVHIVRGRAIGEAIVHEAVDHEVDLIVVGSAPRWRRQSRFFSPTVDYVLRKAPCEVMVIAYPQGVLEEALS